jgi:hypothetical protein
MYSFCVIPEGSVSFSTVFVDFSPERDLPLMVSVRRAIPEGEKFQW